MKGKKIIYIFLIIIAIILFVLSMTVLGNTEFIAPVVITLSVYLFLGALVKLCKESDKLRDTIICTIDLLFWLP